jgi:hypothetical protein
MINTICSSLKYELGEFCSALQKYQFDSRKDTESQGLKLYIASPLHVIDPTTLIGRIRILFDKLYKWIKGNPYRGTLHEPIETIIHNLFDKVVQEAYKARQSRLAHHVRLIESHFNLNSDLHTKEGQKNRYYRHLETELKVSHANLNNLAENFYLDLEKGPLGEEDLDALRHLVTNVSEAVRPFWHKMLYNRHTFGAPLNSYIPSDVCNDIENKTIDWAINDLSLYQALSKEQEWINLEIMLQQSVPLIELIKLSDPTQNLEESERRKLAVWIKGLNDLGLNSQSPKNRISAVSLLRNVLNEVVQATAIQGHFQINVGQLVNKLDDYGCKLMQIEDRNHVAWRRQLKKGDVITCNGENFTLGEELQNKKVSSLENQNSTRRFKPLPRKRDKYKIFNLESHPELIVKIGSSPFDLAINSHKFQEFHCGIPGVTGVDKISETDDKRPVVFLEKIPLLLSSHHWTSNECRLNEKDERILSRVASSLFCMRDWRKWLEGVTLERLGINKDQIFTSLDWLEGGDDNYLAAEKFCIEIANSGGTQNVNVLRYLMEVSGYSQHPMADFYREIVMTMLKTGDFNFVTFSLPRDCDRQEYTKQAKNLFKQAKTLRDACVDEVTKNIEDKVKETEKQKVQSLKKIEDLQDEIKSVKAKGNSEKLKRDKYELQMQIYALKDGMDALNQSIQKEFLGYLENWQYFREEKDHLLDAMTKNREELIKNKQELESAGSGQKEHLIELNKELELQSIEFQSNIITYAVYERLLEAYSDLPTPGCLPDSLFETVVNSFKNGGLEKIPVDSKYYQEQQNMIIAKNQYAIQLMQQGG